METIGQIISSGIIIGILISAPMGPVGMLIIQRTLNKGRWAAFFTGVGAGISDIMYCLLTGLGLTFIVDFIEIHKTILEVMGSIVLLAFGFFLFRKNPVRAMRRQRDNANSFVKDFGTGFIFTFSNPLIMFFIMGLFSRFAFIMPDFRCYHYITAFSSILLGSLIWWFFITFVVNKLRSHFNVRSMWILNRVIGSILMLMALVGVWHGVSVIIKNNSLYEPLPAASVYKGT